MTGRRLVAPLAGDISISLFILIEDWGKKWRSIETNEFQSGGSTFDETPKIPGDYVSSVLPICSTR
jgi:hypothetical protein